MPDGKREKIPGYWPTSIHDTPENRADKTIGIFNPVTGSLSAIQINSDGTSSAIGPTCDVKYEKRRPVNSDVARLTPLREATS